MFKIHQGFSQVFFLELYHNYNENNFYSLLSQPNCQVPRINTTLKGTEYVRYLQSVIWNNFPIEIRSIKYFDTFKTEIKKWKLKNC